jgi:hypothetical protein
MRERIVDWSIVCTGADVEGFLGKVHTQKQGEVFLDTPRVVGWAILELSKLHVLEFHYAVIKGKYGPHALLLMTDTDLLIYHLQTDELMSEFADLREHLDLAESFPLVASPDSKGRFEKSKEEFEDAFCRQYVGATTTKMYSTVSYDANGRQHFIKGADGIPTRVLQLKRLHEHYLKMLDEPARDDVTNRAIRSVGHGPVHISITKTALSAYNDKVYLISSRHA